MKIIRAKLQQLLYCSYNLTMYVVCHCISFLMRETKACMQIWFKKNSIFSQEILAHVQKILCNQWDIRHCRNGNQQCLHCLFLRKEISTVMEKDTFLDYCLVRERSNLQNIQYSVTCYCRYKNENMLDFEVPYT